MSDRGLAYLVAQCRGQNAPAACATWTPTTVGRYPAVLDSRGQCRLMTGVADQAVLLVNDVAQPECQRANEIAAAALITLREAVLTKPLRRTAWSMLIGGLGGTALMLGAGAIMVSNGPPAGPGQEATWPAATTMSLDRIPGERNSGDPAATCTVIPDGRAAEQNRRFTIGEPTSPDFIGTATVTCDQPVALMTGTSRVVADYTCGPLIVVPLFITVLGILFFFPRFTHSWVRLSTRGWLRKCCGSHQHTDHRSGSTSHEDRTYVEPKSWTIPGSSLPHPGHGGVGRTSSE